MVGPFLIAGTQAGDVVVFSMGSLVFRTSLPVVNNGVTSIKAGGYGERGALVYVAGGDGKGRLTRHCIKGHLTVILENIMIKRIFVKSIFLKIELNWKLHS
jgi:hypothetical protein